MEGSVGYLLLWKSTKMNFTNTNLNYLHLKFLHTSTILKRNQYYITYVCK